MPDENDLKRLLSIAAQRAGKSVTQQQLSEAVTELRNRKRLGMVKKADVEAVGQKVANDQQLFATTDIDDVNTVLDTLGN